MESSTIENTVSNEAVAIPTPAPVPYPIDLCILYSRAETPAQAVEDKVEVPSQEAVEKEAAEQDKKEATEQEVEEEVCDSLDHLQNRKIWKKRRMNLNPKKRNGFLKKNMLYSMILFNYSSLRSVEEDRI